mmetsp:Transcript_6476/g.7233  ORF Transcript_6476/g.7233 Transcript_6476/m.7233 type:complete len:179 (+) Transcript_6476:638-1174(+)
MIFQRNKILSFINSNKMVYKCRASKCYVFNSTSGLRWLYKLFSPFFDERAKKKLVILDGDYSQELVDNFHPSQLEQKFGGEAENITTYWPPYEASQEYGEDPTLFTIEGEEDTFIDDERSVVMNGCNNNMIKYKMTPNLTPCNSKKTDSASDEIKADDIIIEEKLLDEEENETEKQMI